MGHSRPRKESMKRLLAIGLVAALGCGAAEDGYDELGTSEQAMTGSTVSGFSQFGRLSAGGACPYAPTASTKCYVPSDKVITWWVPEHLAQGDAGVNLTNWWWGFTHAAAILNAAGTGFTFVQASGPGDPNTDVGLYSNFAMSGGATNMDAYFSLTTPGPDVFLTESLTGQWVKTGYQDMHIDDAKVNANSCSGTCGQAQRDHIAGMALLRAAGSPYIAGSGTALANRSSSVATPTTATSSVNICLMNKFSASNPTTYANSGTCP